MRWKYDLRKMSNKTTEAIYLTAHNFKQSSTYGTQITENMTKFIDQNHFSEQLQPYTFLMITGELPMGSTLVTGPFSSG